MSDRATLAALPGAEISPCGLYRYTLHRASETVYPERGAAAFVMLNPSTADVALNDPTINRCRAFARTWSCAGLTVGNLYALRSTDPSALWRAADPVGPENDYHLRRIAAEYGDIVCAWGVNARSDRVAAFCALAKAAGARLWCLGVTKNGSPRHPLYVRADQPLIPWRFAAAAKEPGHE